MTFSPLIPKPRPVLDDFMAALEETLRRNDFKPCWTQENQWDLLDKLREEMAELEHELRVSQEVPGSYPRVGMEALDVAAVALMLWDRSRGASQSQNRGRA